MPSNYFEKDISLKASNNGKKKISGLKDRNKSRLTTSNSRFQNRLLSKLSSNFREMTFNESKFPASTPVSDIQFECTCSQNNHPFYCFNKQLNYELAHYFTELETTKRNTNRCFTNQMIKLITKKLLYYNTDMEIKNCLIYCEKYLTINELNISLN